VLSLTDNAATEIRNLIAQPEVPDDGGVRIASGPEGSLTLALAAAPADGDAVVEEQGARVFVEPQAGEVLDELLLDAAVDPEGHVQFSLGEQV
jgi:Fe-S cluster assembly iron-binding protein IscA